MCAHMHTLLKPFHTIQMMKQHLPLLKSCIGIEDYVASLDNYEKGLDLPLWLQMIIIPCTHAQSP